MRSGLKVSKNVLLRHFIARFKSTGVDQIAVCQSPDAISCELVIPLVCLNSGAKCLIWLYLHVEKLKIKKTRIPKSLHVFVNS